MKQQLTEEHLKIRAMIEKNNAEVRERMKMETLPTAQEILDELNNESR